MENNLTKSEELFCRKLQDFLVAVKRYNSNESNSFYIDFVLRPKNDGSPVYFDSCFDDAVFTDDFPKD